MGELRIRRIYETAEPADGFRALVDRLWPRGVSTEHAALDAWWKDLAPTPELRTEWHRNPEEYESFAEHYRAEIAANPAVEEALAVIRERPVVTLLYAAHDTERNHAIILRDALAARL